MKVYISLAGSKSKFDLLGAVEDAKATFFEIGQAPETRSEGSQTEEFWQTLYDEMGASDVVLMELDSKLSDAQLVEVGMALTLRKRLVVIKSKGVHRPPVLRGITSDVFDYKDHDDLVDAIKRLDGEHYLSSDDRIMYLMIFVMALLGVAYLAAQVFIPLGPVVALVVWLIARRYIQFVHDFDRVLIYIPLALVWVWISIIINTLTHSNIVLIAWTVIYWPAVLYMLKRFKFSL